MTSKNTFTEQVYNIVKRIPAGKVATYGQVAQLAGSPGAARAVGMAMKHNPNSKVVPCHRVVGADGSMHGYAFGGTVTKEEMLRREGVRFAAAGKVDLVASAWQ
jgi:methylated-DNA-protein-cysteine methyltransferase-like protein